MDRSLPLAAAHTCRPVTVINNPTAGGGRRRRLDAALSALRALGGPFEVRHTGARGDAERLAAGAVNDGAGLVVVAGGDGTINEALNGLMGANAPQRGTALALIPLGTANVLAAEAGLPRDAAGIARTIAHGIAAPVALGRANGRHFAMMAGVGFDAEVVAHVDPGLKQRFGKAAYVAEIARRLTRYGDAVFLASLDGGEPVRTAALVAANGHFYGGRYVLAPAARLADAGLHACLFTRPGRGHALRYMLAMQAGRLARASGYAVAAARRIDIDGPAGAPVQADGDIVARLPVRIDTVDPALCLLVPG